jgi:hypothetical protein
MVGSAEAEENLIEDAGVILKADSRSIDLKKLRGSESKN